jgi:hypothetical protein
MTATTSDHIEVAESDQKKNRVFKRPYRIGDKIIVVLEESLMKKLKIDDENIWFEEIAQKDGILLKIAESELF